MVSSGCRLHTALHPGGIRKGGRHAGQIFSRHLTRWGSMTKSLAFTAETTRLALRHRNAPLNLYESTYAMGVAGRQPDRLLWPASMGGK